MLIPVNLTCRILNASHCACCGSGGETYKKPWKEYFVDIPVEQVPNIGEKITVDKKYYTVIEKLVNFLTNDNGALTINSIQLVATREE